MENNKNNNKIKYDKISDDKSKSDDIKKSDINKSKSDDIKKSDINKSKSDDINKSKDNKKIYKIYDDINEELKNYEKLNKKLNIKLIKKLIYKLILKKEKLILEKKNLNNKLIKEKDKFIRLFADFENYKKRIQKERLEIIEFSNKNIIIQLLSILDDFNRGNEEINKIKGIILIKEKFENILKKYGVKKMSIKVGDNFNTDLHESITQIKSNSKNLIGKIVDVIESGYFLKNKVIRHAKVVIGGK
ncbi:nucleotide exchange factor GrpE [Candidatus Shikimatogenerans silvanidophilus]|uniref:nucleotide exchange factor GrpE n=1 Tax=Candidatus Shikimatogenerans silvanidophilus TaxID=2782547 RepID=UPI001BA8ED2C|nr:nucleotide exchange factor GrpE [Candidatus Shikimatogenerans silvanidophilus]